MAVDVTTENAALAAINADYEQRYGFHDAENYLYKAPKGLNREIVEKISEFKSEPQWMREFRLKALEHFLSRPQPTWISAASKTSRMHCGGGTTSFTRWARGSPTTG